MNRHFRRCLVGFGSVVLSAGFVTMLGCSPNYFPPGAVPIVDVDKVASRIELELPEGFASEEYALDLRERIAERLEERDRLTRTLSTPVPARFKVKITTEAYHYLGAICGIYMYTPLGCPSGIRYATAELTIEAGGKRYTGTGSSWVLKTIYASAVNRAVDHALADAMSNLKEDGT